MHYDNYSPLSLVQSQTMEKSSRGLIFDIRRYSVNDGPGIRTTVFLKGCPLSCAWCHNPEGRSGQVELMVRAGRCIRCMSCEYLCPKSALTLTDRGPSVDRALCDVCGECVEDCYSGTLELAGRLVDACEVVEQVGRDQLFFEQSQGGVTFSGGEPLRQVDFLRELLTGCKQQGIHTTVDTCGYASWEAFEPVLALTDLFLYDFKLADSVLHKQYTGVSTELILANLQKLSALGKRIWVRIPVVPGINDTTTSIQAAGEFLSSLPSLELVELLPYHGSAVAKYEGLGLDYELSNIQSPSPEHMEEIAAGLRNFELRVKSG
jgi:pyruvate formate lyase activating enzyme